MNFILSRFQPSQISDNLGVLHYSFRRVLKWTHSIM
jgi:hypothetical protein